MNDLKFTPKGSKGFDPFESILNIKENNMSQPSLEAERAVELENFWNNLTNEQEARISEYFISEQREWGGRGVTKDNFEDLFDQWSQDLNMDEINDILIADTDFGNTRIHQRLVEEDNRKRTLNEAK